MIKKRKLMQDTVSSAKAQHGPTTVHFGENRTHTDKRKNLNVLLLKCSHKKNLNVHIQKITDYNHD